jgi:protein-disulfide isomerase
MKRTWTLVSLILVTAVAGCAKRAAEPASGKRIAIRFADEAITVDEIDKRIGPELFELRAQAMRAVLVDRLLNREARRRGLDLEQMRQQEIEAKVPMPTDAEAQAVLAEWVKAGRLKTGEAASMSPAVLADRVRSMRVNEAEEAFYDRIMKESSVQVDFNAIGKPALELAPDGPTLGPKDAPLTIVEFADLSQPFTAMWQQTLETLVDKYQGRVQFRFKQKPSAPDADGALLAEGALCADEQGHYWEFRKALFKNKDAKGAAALVAAQASAKLDTGAFERCMASGGKKAIVAQNVREAARNRLEGEPVLSVNGILLSGAQDLATIERLLRIESGGA